MKKITLKISAFLLLTMFAFQVQGQAFDGTPGFYKLRVTGTSLYVTQDVGVNNLKYQAEAAGSDTQLFRITNHPSGTNYSIVSQVTGEGAVEPNSTDTVSPTLGCQGNDPVASGQQDRWEIRSGINLFLDSDATGTDWESLGAKRRVNVPSAGISANANLFLSGGTRVNFDFIFVATLSNDKFDTSSIFISNPVKNEINIKGLNANVKEVSVYSLLGQKMMTKEVTAESSDVSIDASSLRSGMYLVEMKADNGSYTKKIVKE